MSVRVIPSSAVHVVHAGNAVTGEVPFWDERDGTLWWIDIQGQRLLGYRPADGSQRVENLPSMPGLIAGRRRGGLILGLEDGLYPFDAAAGLGARLIGVEESAPLNRINDGKPDPAGRLWFGTMDKTGQFLATGSLYCLEADGRLRRVLGDLNIPNAIDFSPDGRSMYLAESHRRRLDVMDYDPQTGAHGPARTFLKLAKGTLPDGCCIDAEGALWVAIIGGSRIERRLPDGQLDAIIELPVSRPTMPILGGADGRTLFITSQRRILAPDRLKAEPLAGDLLAVRVDVPAKPVNLVAA